MLYSTLLLFASLIFAPGTDCENFTVDNESSYDIGIVAVTGLGTPVPIDVTDTGLFSDTVCFLPLGVLINGQNALYPDTTTITLADESTVNVLWQSTQIVYISNQELQDGPMQ
jgi:hypothetical protein